MTLDSNQPVDSTEVGELPGYIREDRTEINSLLTSSNLTVTELEVAAGATSISVAETGGDLGEVGIEIVLISGAAAVTISTIIGGTEGQIKIFIFQDGNVSFTDGSKSLGRMYLNQLPASSNFDAAQDDVLVLVNIDGDGSSNYGYWKELHRQVSIK